MHSYIITHNYYLWLIDTKKKINLFKFSPLNIYVSTHVFITNRSVRDYIIVLINKQKYYDVHDTYGQNNSLCVYVCNWIKSYIIFRMLRVAIDRSLRESLIPTVPEIHNDYEIAVL